MSWQATGAGTVGDSRLDAGRRKGPAYLTGPVAGEGGGRCREQITTSALPPITDIERGSVWSRRLVHRIQTVPDFDDGADIPICVQCRDTAGGGLSPDDDIAFAITVTLEIEADVQYDILEEIEQQVRLRLQPGA